MSINGPPDGPPYRIPVPVTDLCGGMNAAIGVLAALAVRERTGRGQHVDTSLYEAGIALGVYEAAGVFANGEVPERLGQSHRGSAPYQIFATADGYMTVGAASEAFWGKVCGILGCEELTEDPRFRTKPDRVRNVRALEAALEPWFQRRTTDFWCERFEEAGVPAGPVLNHAEMLRDPQTIARGMVAEVEHPRAGAMRTLGVPVKLSETPGGVRRPAPLLGEHTREVAREWLADEEAEAAD